MKATVPAFVTGVTFPTEKPGGLARAWLRLQDDADCHHFKVAVPLDFAHFLSERVQLDDEVRVQITFDFEEDPT